MGISPNVFVLILCGLILLIAVLKQRNKGRASGMSGFFGYVYRTDPDHRSLRDHPTDRWNSDDPHNHGGWGWRSRREDDDDDRGSRDNDDNDSENDLDDSVSDDFDDGFDNDFGSDFDSDR